ncbi:MAG: hypothetical protein KIH65_001870 [Candidatus Uhrbacteria bacterium]|nr:hypothetical protein [Candidatus Uhrbacteria bacterium]
MLFASLLLILLSACPAWAGDYDAKEGDHFAIISRMVEDGKERQVVRIHRHIVDTRQFAALFGTDMFRIRADNLTKTLALCHVGGPFPWRRKLVRREFVEEDRASSEYWDRHCPDQAQRYVYMIPGEEIVIMTTQGIQEREPSGGGNVNSDGPVNSGADIGVPTAVVAAPQMNLSDQIAACRTPKCVWDLVSPIASSVTWPSAQPKPLPATNDAPSASPLPMMMGTGMMWSDPLMADLHACTNLDCITATLRFASISDTSLTQGTEHQSSQSVGVPSRREVMLETALTTQSIGFYLAVGIALVACVMVLIMARRETKMRRYYEYRLENNDDALYVRNRELEESLRQQEARFAEKVGESLANARRATSLAQDAAEANQSLTRLLHSCVNQGERIELPETASTREHVTALEQAIGSLRRKLYREMSVMVTGLNKEARLSIDSHNTGTYKLMQTALIQDLRFAIRAYIDTTLEERDAALQRDVTRICRLIGVNHIASTEEGLQHLSACLAWMSSEFARMWEGTSIERVKFQGAEVPEFTYWVRHLESALPQIETMLSAYSAEVERLRTEAIGLKSSSSQAANNNGSSDWRFFLFKGIGGFFRDQRAHRGLSLESAEQFDALQTFLGLVYQVEILLKGQQLWLKYPADMELPSASKWESVPPPPPDKFC